MSATPASIQLVVFVLRVSLALNYQGSAAGKAGRAMAQVFISYAKEDRPTAERVAEILGTRHWDVWWDRELVAGASFDKVIEEQLDAADAVIVLWSQTSVRSEWVRAEATAAVDRGVLVPIQIGPSQIPLRFRNVQTIELTDWGGAVADSRMDGLDRALRSVTRSQPAPSTTSNRVTELDVTMTVTARVLQKPQRFDRVDLVKEAVGQPVEDGDEGRWILGDLMVAQAGEESIEIPVGFTIDGGSVPSWAQPVEGWKAWKEPQRWAAVTHEWLYTQRGVAKADADRAFRALLGSEGAGSLKKNFFYLAARFGSDDAYGAYQARGPQIFT